MLTIIERGSAEYVDTLGRLARRGDADLERVEPTVKDILKAVRERGDEAVAEFTTRFEQRKPGLKLEGWREQAQKATPSVRGLLEEAAARIRTYHEHQREPGFSFEKDGIRLGMRVRPLEAVGLYAPGGKARYPSTVLMTAVPAAVAGVPRIVLATPNPTPEILAAAEVAGVTEVVDAGGAQAIGLLAYGTQSVPRVDKIVGPGNIYVACAKRLVYGVVDIDSIAGPSEILVVADQSAKPAHVAADLLSQAEHDEDAYPLLVAWTRSQAEEIARHVEAQLEWLPRREIARVSIKHNGYCFVVHDQTEAARVASHLAAEHLSLSVADPDALLPHIGAAGAIFVGCFTPEAAGDYAAGPSHVLPTGGAARYASPLGVYDFLVRTSLIQYTQQSLKEQAHLLQSLANLEGLQAHARAIEVRLPEADEG